MLGCAYDEPAMRHTPAPAVEVYVRHVRGSSCRDARQPRTCCSCTCGRWSATERSATQEFVSKKTDCDTRGGVRVNFASRKSVLQSRGGQRLSALPMSSCESRPPQEPEASDPRCRRLCSTGGVSNCFNDLTLCDGIWHHASCGCGIAPVSLLCGEWQDISALESGLVRAKLELLD